MAESTADTADEETRPKWRRTSKPKTRTGCIACKRKKVKCDEYHPGCLRCSRSRIICEYPAPKGPDKVKAKGPTRYIALQAAPPKRDLQLLGLRPSGALSKETEIDNRFLRHFQHRTTSGFESVMDWSLWNHLVLQFSHQEPFVRDSVVAIGALICSLEAVTVPKSPISDSSLSSSETTQSEMSKNHRAFALLKYSKAVKAMQTVLPGAEPRQVMIASLLVFCFETLLNNRYYALSHVVSAQRLFREWLSQSQSVSRSRNPNLLSPAPAAVEEELVEAFEHLDLQISTIWDARPAALHKSILREGRDAVQSMPDTFTSIAEARKYLTLVIRRSHHFIATTWVASETSSLSHEFSLQAPTDFAVTAGTNIFSTSLKVPDQLRDEQKGYADVVARFERAFEPIFRKTRQEGEKDSKSEGRRIREYIIATLLRLHLLATRIVVAGVIFTGECAYDAFLPEFAEMLDLAEIIVDAYHNRHSSNNSTKQKNNTNWTSSSVRFKPEPSSSAAETAFSLDLGLTPSLFLITLRCRDGLLRRRTLAILRSWHAEACWEPNLIAEYGTFVMEVEEENIVLPQQHQAGGQGYESCRGQAERFPQVSDIPEEKRAVVSRISEAPSASAGAAERGMCEALLQVVLRCGGADGGPVWRERYITYETAGTSR